MNVLVVKHKETKQFRIFGYFTTADFNEMVSALIHNYDIVCCCDSKELDDGLLESLLKNKNR